MSTDTLWAIVILAVVVGGLVLGIRASLKPTPEDLHRWKGDELVGRLAELTDEHLRQVFMDLAYGPPEYQAMLEASLGAPADAPEAEE